jgi:hypothetical protein
MMERFQVGCKGHGQRQRVYKSLTPARQHKALGRVVTVAVLPVHLHVLTPHATATGSCQHKTRARVLGRVVTVVVLHLQVLTPHATATGSCQHHTRLSQALHMPSASCRVAASVSRAHQGGGEGEGDSTA